MKAMKAFAGALALAALLVVVLTFGATPAAAQVATSEPSPPAVGQVTGLTASSAGMADGAVRVRWTAAENAQTYIVAYIRSDDAAAGSYGRTQVVGFNGTDGTIDGLDGGVSYDFIAVGMRWNWARYQPVWGEWSNRDSATPGGTPPSAPRPSPPPEPQWVGQVTDLMVGGALGQNTGAVQASLDAGGERAGAFRNLYAVGRRRRRPQQGANGGFQRRGRRDPRPGRRHILRFHRRRDALELGRIRHPLGALVATAKREGYGNARQLGGGGRRLGRPHRPLPRYGRR